MLRMSAVVPTLSFRCASFQLVPRIGCFGRIPDYFGLDLFASVMDRLMEGVLLPHAGTHEHASPYRARVLPASSFSPRHKQVHTHTHNWVWRQFL